MAGNVDLVLAVLQWQTAGNTQLLAHNVHTSDHLRDRMLNLYPRVHFNEVELAVLIQEFEGAGADVADFLAGIHARLKRSLAGFLVDVWRRRFFNDLLVAALHGAVPVTQMAAWGAGAA